MKDKDLYQPSAEADFDARCRSLLEDRAVAAPGPRADLFAAASANAGTARLWYGGAAALLIAGAFLWFSWPMEEPMVPEALPELMNQEIPEAIGEGVVDRVERGHAERDQYDELQRRQPCVDAPQRLRGPRDPRGGGRRERRKRRRRKRRRKRRGGVVRCRHGDPGGGRRVTDPQR